MLPTMYQRWRVERGREARHRRARRESYGGQSIEGKKSKSKFLFSSAVRLVLKRSRKARMVNGFYRPLFISSFFVLRFLTYLRRQVRQPQCEDC